MAAAVMQGRAVPLRWASYTTGQLPRSRLDRLILILARTILLLTGLGRLARGRFRPGVGPLQRPNECSDGTVGWGGCGTASPSRPNSSSVP